MPSYAGEAEQSFSPFLVHRLLEISPPPPQHTHSTASRCCPLRCTCACSVAPSSVCCWGLGHPTVRPPVVCSHP